MLLCSLNIERQSEFLVGLKEPTSCWGVIWAVISGCFIFWLLLCLWFWPSSSFSSWGVFSWVIDASSVLWVLIWGVEWLPPWQTAGVRGLCLSPALRSHLHSVQIHGHVSSCFPAQWVSCCPLVPGQEESCEWIAENSGNGQRHICPGCKHWLQNRICLVEL